MYMIFSLSLWVSVCEMLACYFLKACLGMVIRRGYDLTLVKRFLAVVLSED